MTPDEFKNLLGTDAEKYTQEQLDVYYATSVKLFGRYFDKWKKEKFSSNVT